VSRPVPSRVLRNDIAIGEPMVTAWERHGDRSRPRIDGALDHVLHRHGNDRLKPTPGGCQLALALGDGADDDQVGAAAQIVEPPDRHV
jgi:hypothetical protein